ncbi:hypothetical protein GCM10009643_09170 [Microbacterium aurantiacum]
MTTSPPTTPNPEDPIVNTTDIPAYALLVQLSAAVDRAPWLELREEEPEVFGAGHIVVYAGDLCRFAITEHCDRPSDDPDRDVIGWQWQTAERTPGNAWRTTTTGHADTEHIRDLLTAATEWMSVLYC